MIQPQPPPKKTNKQTNKQTTALKKVQSSPVQSPVLVFHLAVKHYRFSLISSLKLFIAAK